MNVKIIAIGKIKEQYLKDAIKEYEKRLTPFCTFSIVELIAEQILDESLCERYKELEADRILLLLAKFLPSYGCECLTKTGLSCTGNLGISREK